MRFCEDIAITKTIVHVIDGNGDEPLLGASLLELDEETYMYLHNHIHKALNNNMNSRGEFLINTGLVYKQCFEMVDGSDFIEASARIAKHLFKIVKNTLSAPSGDLVVVEIVVEGKRGIGILFMEYKTSFIHDIKFEESMFKVDLKPQTIALPHKGQRLGKFAFFGEGSSDIRPYELIMMEKTSLDENGEKVEFFISDFLQASIVADNTDITKIFRGATEKWIRKNMKENIGGAIESRATLDEQYINDAEIDIKGTLNGVIDSIEEREKFLMNLEKAGIDTETPFEVDKKWIGKKLKEKTIKTDTGFTLKGDYDIFDDTSRIEIQYNGDGTVNYIIKQVRNIHQS